MLVTISPPARIGGTAVTAPPSKSMAHRAVLCCRAGKGHLSHRKPRVQQGHLGHPRRCRAALRPGAHPARPTPLWRGWGSFRPVFEPGGLLRERQHPALPHPSGQPYRADHHLCGPRAADGTAPVCVRERYIESRISSFEQRQRAADRGRTPAQRGVHAGGQCVQPVHQRAAVRPAPAGRGQHPPSASRRWRAAATSR